MEQHRQNKEFIVRYFNAMAGVTVTREILEEYNGKMDKDWAWIENMSESKSKST
jgi:hypothetical protein